MRRGLEKTFDLGDYLTLVVIVSLLYTQFAIFTIKAKV